MSHHFTITTADFPGETMRMVYVGRETKPMPWKILKPCVGPSPCQTFIVIITTAAALKQTNCTPSPGNKQDNKSRSSSPSEQSQTAAPPPPRPPRPRSTHWPALAAAPGGPWSPRRDGGTSASGAPGRPPSSCPCPAAAWPGSPGRRGLPPTCAYGGRSGCLWRPPSESHSGTPACGRRAARPPGTSPSGCFWFALRGTEGQGVRTDVAESSSLLL